MTVNESKRNDPRYWTNLPESARGTMESALARAHSNDDLVNSAYNGNSGLESSCEDEEEILKEMFQEGILGKKRLFPINPPSIDSLLAIIRQKAPSQERAKELEADCMKTAAKYAEKAGRPGTKEYVVAWVENYRSNLGNIATRLVIGTLPELREDTHDQGYLSL